jgi:hypothetical protein
MSYVNTCTEEGASCETRGSTDLGCHHRHPYRPARNPNKLFFQNQFVRLFIGPVVPAWTTSKWPLRNNYVPFIPDRRIYSPRSLSRTDSAISQSAWRHRYHVRDLGLITVVLDRKFPGQF